jgi:hypothetical protein
MCGNHDLSLCEKRSVGHIFSHLYTQRRSLVHRPHFVRAKNEVVFLAGPKPSSRALCFNGDRTEPDYSTDTKANEPE